MRCSATRSTRAPSTAPPRRSSSSRSSTRTRGRTPRLAESSYLTPRLAWILQVRGIKEISANFDGPNGVGVPDGTRDAQALIDAYGHLSSRAPGPGWAVAHGDAHVGNTFLDRDGRPGLLDWQVTQYGPWGIDVGYHIASALEPDVRAANERDLLRHYLGALTAAGVTNAPSFDDAWNEYRCGLVHGFFLWGITQYVQPDIIATLLRRLGTAARRARLVRGAATTTDSLSSTSGNRTSRDNELTERPAPSHHSARRMLRRRRAGRGARSCATLLVAVVGSSSTRYSASGHLNPARRSAANARSAARVTSASGRATTTAHTRSPIDGLAHPDDRDLHHVGVIVEHGFDLGAVHVLAAADDDVLDAVDDVHEAVGVDVPDVARVEPAVVERRPRRRLVVPVALDHLRRSEAELADLADAEHVRRRHRRRAGRR